MKMVEEKGMIVHRLVTETEDLLTETDTVRVKNKDLPVPIGATTPDLILEAKMATADRIPEAKMAPAVRILEAKMEMADRIHLILPLVRLHTDTRITDKMNLLRTCEIGQNLKTETERQKIMMVIKAESAAAI